VNWSAGEVAEVPPRRVVTVTSTVPGIDTGGVATLIWVSETTVKEVREMLSKLTTVAPVKLVPVMLITVPPASGPAFGMTEVTVGWLTKGFSSERTAPEILPLPPFRLARVPDWGVEELAEATGGCMTMDPATNRSPRPIRALGLSRLGIGSLHRRAARRRWVRQSAFRCMAHLLSGSRWKPKTRMEATRSAGKLRWVRWPIGGVDSGVRPVLLDG